QRMVAGVVTGRVASAKPTARLPRFDPSTIRHNTDGWQSGNAARWKRAEPARVRTFDPCTVRQVSACSPTVEAPGRERSRLGRAAARPNARPLVGSAHRLTQPTGAIAARIRGRAPGLLSPQAAVTRPTAKQGRGRREVRVLGSPPFLVGSVGEMGT